MSNSIKIIPFGGVRENGKNMYAVEVDKQIFVWFCAEYSFESEVGKQAYIFFLCLKHGVSLFPQR